MTTVWEDVAAALSGLSEPIAAGQYLAASEAELPNTFLVYSLVTATARQHADDGETLRTRRVQINLYSRSGLAGLPDTDTPMLAAGFRRGPERELPYNRDTRHYGLVREYIYLNEEA